MGEARAHQGVGSGPWAQMVDPMPVQPHGHASAVDAQGHLALVPARAIHHHPALVDKTRMTPCEYCGGDLDRHDYVERMHCERLAAAMARLTTTH